MIYVRKNMIAMKLVTDRSIYCHMTLSAMHYLLFIHSARTKFCPFQPQQQVLVTRSLTHILSIHFCCKATPSILINRRRCDNHQGWSMYNLHYSQLPHISDTSFSEVYFWSKKIHSRVFNTTFVLLLFYLKPER